MKVCFPVQQDDGMNSEVYNHFGSAPLFIVVDTETNSIGTISNGDQHHAHGACNPLKALDSQKVDAVVVGGIGAGALSRLNQNGIKVYRAQSPSIRENITMFASQNLPEFKLQGCCGGHSPGSECAH